MMTFDEALATVKHWRDCCGDTNYPELLQVDKEDVVEVYEVLLKVRGLIEGLDKGEVRFVGKVGKL